LHRREPRRREQAGVVFLGEQELARAMIHHVLERFGRDKAQAPNS
jgi:hypothetical protein